MTSKEEQLGLQGRDQSGPGQAVVRLQQCAQCGSLNFQPQSQHSQGHGPVFSTPIFQTTELAQSDALVAPAQINPLFQVPYQNGSLGAVSRILSPETLCHMYLE